MRQSHSQLNKLKRLHFSEPLIQQPAQCTAKLTAHSPAHPHEQTATQHAVQPVALPGAQPVAQLVAQSEPRRSSRIAILPTPVYDEQSPARPVRSSTKPDNASTKPDNSSTKPVKLPTTKSRKLKYPLKKMFTWSRCHDLSQRYKLAVYQNSDKGPEAQAKAVKAVFYHEQDYPDSSVEEKIEFHQFCGSWCKVKSWEHQEKPLEEFTRTKRDIHGNEQVWEGGLLAKFKIQHPEAYDELLGIFVKLGDEQLMSRCGKVVTQNINESIHSKMWRYCLKTKKHTKKRYIFGAQHVIMSHNFGHNAASLHHILGTMTKPLDETLKYEDIVSRRAAERKHVLKDGGNKNYRIKRVYKPQVNDDTSYEPGSEPIV